MTNPSQCTSYFNGSFLNSTWSFTKEFCKKIRELSPTTLTKISLFSLAIFAIYSIYKYRKSSEANHLKLIREYVKREYVKLDADEKVVGKITGLISEYILGGVNEKKQDEKKQDEKILLDQRFERLKHGI